MPILSFAYHVNQLNTGQNGLRPTKRLNHRHQPCSSFAIPQVLRHKLIQAVTLPDGDGVIFLFPGIERAQRRRVGATLIDDPHIGFAMVANGFAEKA